MAADLETLRIEVTHLAGIEVAGCAQESGGEVEGCVESKITEYGRRCNQIGLATIVESDTDILSGSIADGFSDVDPAPTAFLQPRHLLAEAFKGQNVAHIARLGLAQLAARHLQFVVHQENNA